MASNTILLSAATKRVALSEASSVGTARAQGRSRQPTVNSQGLPQWALRLYLFALRDDKTEPLRMYVRAAPQRITRSAVGTESGRAVPDFDLQAQMAHRAADFSDGELVDNELRARGNIVELLRDCPLAMASASRSDIRSTNKEDVWKESLVRVNYGRSITNRQTLDTPVALSME